MLPFDLHRSALCLAVVVGHDAISEDGVSLVHIGAVDRGVDRLPLPDEDDFALCSGYCRIQQVPAQHDIVLFQQRDDDRRDLSALRFVDGNAL